MILVNKNTVQTPLTSPGRTGTQSIRYIPAPRVYLCPPDASPNPQTFFGPSFGTTPPGFSDLGIVNGNAKVTLSRSTNDVYAGVDRFCVGTYSQGIRGEIDFALSQADDYVMEAITGLVPTSWNNGVYSSYLVGVESMLQVGLLLVVQNKLDGKEFQFYNPTALLKFSIAITDSDMSLSVAGFLPGFAGSASLANQLLSLTVIAPTVAATSTGIPTYGYGITPYGSNYGDPGTYVAPTGYNISMDGAAIAAPEGTISVDGGGISSTPGTITMDGESI